MSMIDHRAEMLAQYAWLDKEPGPKMLRAGLDLYGLKEIVGLEHNPVILGWAKTLNLPQYRADETPWCGLFVAWLAYVSGKEPVKDPLWARNWAQWGKKSEPELGAVLVFSREKGGHVGLYVGEDADCYHVLGGNQENRVCIAPIHKKRLVGCRSMYKIKPANVRKIILQPEGWVSLNEA